MLVECGFVKAQTSEGAEFTFAPSLGRIATLGSPTEIVDLYAALHGARAEQEAAYILACCCEQDDTSGLIGHHDEAGVWHPGAMPASEQIIIARHLMQHGIVGKASPAKQGDGKFSPRFDAAEYISAARVHLGLSSADAEALSMTEFQVMLEMKFPPEQDTKRDLPSREEYEAQMQANRERVAAAKAKAADHG